MFCRKCGTKNDDTAKFCYKCGYAFQGSPAQAGTSPVQAQPVVPPVQAQPVVPPVQPQPVVPPVQPQPVVPPVQAQPVVPPVQPQPVVPPVQAQPVVPPVQPQPVVSPVQPQPVVPPVQPQPVTPQPMVQPVGASAEDVFDKTVILPVGHKSEMEIKPMPVPGQQVQSVTPSPVQPQPVAPPVQPQPVVPPVQPQQITPPQGQTTSQTFVPQSEEPKPKKKEKKEKGAGKTVLLIIILVIVLAGLGVGGYFAYKHFFAKDSSNVEKALEDDDIAAAVGYLDEVNETERETVEMQIIDKAKLEYNNYVNEEPGYDYDRVKSDLQAISESSVSDKSEIDSLLASMEVIHESRENFQKAKEAQEAGDYIEAISYYKLVSKEDSKYYNEAQEGISSVNANVKEQYLAKAAEYEEAGDYAAAQSILNEALEVVGNDGDIVSELYSVEATLTNQERETAYAELCNTIDSGEYEIAYEMLWLDLEKYPDDYRFTLKKDDLDFAYKSEKFGEAMELYDSGDHEGAVALLESMYYYVPGDEAVATWIERYSD